MSVVDLSYINVPDIGHSIHLVGMMLAREGDTFMVLLPGNDIEDNLTTMVLSHEDWKKVIAQMDFKETEILVKDKGKIKKTIIRKCNRQIKNTVAWNVYRRDDYTCRYCGRDHVPLTVDHLVLWEKGGPSIEENLVAACKRCNNKRGNMPYKEWLNSSFYKEVSKNLLYSVKIDNINLIITVDSIPKRFHKRKRD